MVLINIKTTDNKKNLKFIKDIISQLPDFLKVWNPDLRKEDIDNVHEIGSYNANSKVTGMVINAQDPSGSGRGHTGALYWDEIAYLMNIEEAYSPISFVANTYSKMAKEAGVPAPLAYTTTPNDINTESGKFFHRLWNDSYLLDDAEELTENILNAKNPEEIYNFYISKEVPTFSIFQRWYEFPNRISDPEHMNSENPDNLLYLYEDINVDMGELREKDPIAWQWMRDTRTICGNNLRNIKKDIYCMFLSSSDSAIFDEETAEKLIQYKRQPKAIIDLEIKGLNTAKLRVYDSYKELEFRKKLVVSVDPAKSATGDNLAISIIDLETDDIVADLSIKNKAIRYISDILVSIDEKFCKKSPIIIERNNFGTAVIERIEEKYPKLYSRLFWHYPKKKNGKKDTSKRIIGVNTSASSREIMFNLLLNKVNDSPDSLRSPNLIEQLLTLEVKNNKIQAASSAHDDSVMSYAIYLYVKQNYFSQLNKFFFDPLEMEIKMESLSIANNSDIKTPNQLMQELKEVKQKILLDDKELSKELLGAFSEDMEKRKTMNPVSFFLQFN